MKLQEEIKTSQGLQGIFDCRIETKIMYPRGGGGGGGDFTEFSSTTTTTTTFIFLKIKPKLTKMKSKQIKSFRGLDALFQYYPQTKR